MGMFDAAVKINLRWNIDRCKSLLSLSSSLKISSAITRIKPCLLFWFIPSKCFKGVRDISWNKY